MTGPGQRHLPDRSPSACSDNRRMPGPRHPPHRTPRHWAALPAVPAQSQPVTVDGLHDGHLRSQPQTADDDPHHDVDHADRQRQVAARQPYPIARLKAVELCMPGGLDRRVMGFDGTLVADLVTTVPHPPGELDALVRVPERFRPASCSIERIPANRNGTLPYRHCRATPNGITYPYPRRPSPRRRPPVRVDDPGLKQAELWVGGKAGRHPVQDIGLGQPRIVIEKEEQLTRHQGDPGVAPGRNSEVFRQRQRAYAVRQVGRLPAVANHHSVDLHPPLGEQCLQGAVKIIRSLALGEDDDAEPRLHHRSRDEVRTATRWPTTVRHAAATRPASNAIVAVPPMNRSSTAATKINNESSTEWNTL